MSTATYMPLIDMIVENFLSRLALSSGRLFRVSSKGRRSRRAFDSAPVNAFGLLSTSETFDVDKGIPSGGLESD